MASNQEVTIPLTYWEDTKKHRVVMAEASGDFVDVLFSFLTLPLGTIIRHGSEIGCINKLYNSVENLNTNNVFWNDICKQMLLSPRNPLEGSCQRLKLNLDDVKVDEEGALATKHFMCHSCSRGRVSDLLLSTFDGAKCYCGASKEVAAGGNGVFVKGDSSATEGRAEFLISDDLTVLPNSPGNAVQLLLKRGHKDFSRMEPTSVVVGMETIINILKHALTSKSPLSDVFSGNVESTPTYSFSPDTGSSHWKGSVKIKVIVSKSKNKILCTEADGDFVDFLFSFLTTPLGSILNLMNHKLSLGRIHNLYTSVDNLDPSWFIGSSKKSLLNPRIAPQFGCNSNPHDSPKCWYVKRPCLFVVSDDLDVAPTRNTSSIPYLTERLEPSGCCFERNVKLVDDLEEHLVEIRKSHEALNLLRASLTSNEAVLTRSLSCLLKMWKCQRCIPFWPFWGVLREWKKKRDKKKKRKTRGRNIVNK